MKLLLVSGDEDFAAVAFEDDFGGQQVSTIIKQIKDGKYIEALNYDLEVLEFGNIDPFFAAFIKNEIVDYDDSKHKTFYLEIETVE